MLILIFLVILSILVLVHEFGHFIIGKMAGIGVEEFALGLPFTKPLISRKLKGGMALSLYPVLFGGFVKLLGEEGEEDGTKKVTGKYFFKGNVWARIGVVVAGVIMNIILALAAFYLFLSLSGFRVLVPKLVDYSFVSPHRVAIEIWEVSPGSPAKDAGLKNNDVVLYADGQRFASMPQFQNYIKEHAGSPVTLTISDLTMLTQKTVTITPRKNPPAGEGALGVGISEVNLLSYRTAKDQILSGAEYGIDMFIYNIVVIKSLAVSSIQTHNAAPVAESVSGPVGIMEAISQIMSLGGYKAIVQLINLTGLLSMSLAFMNILPLPALDGGRMAFLMVEALFGKKMAAKKENLINQIGMFVLLAFILLITFNDIRRVLVDHGILH